MLVQAPSITKTKPHRNSQGNSLQTPVGGASFDNKNENSRVCNSYASAEVLSFLELNICHAPQSKRKRNVMTPYGLKILNFSFLTFLLTNCIMEDKRETTRGSLRTLFCDSRRRANNFTSLVQRARRKIYKSAR